VVAPSIRLLTSAATIVGQNCGLATLSEGPAQRSGEWGQGNILHSLAPIRSVLNSPFVQNPNEISHFSLSHVQ